MAKALPKLVEELSSPRLSRGNWIDAARQALVSGGVGEVKVDRLARDIGVTRGSFYWHFQSREDLLDALLETWRRVHTEPFAAVLAADTDRPAVQLVRFFEVWFDPNRFDPAFDSAVRDWARGVHHVDEMVREADAARTELLQRIFLAIGYEPLEAEIRARVTYYHQVGYYALQIKETIEHRRTLFPTYYKVLAGLPLPVASLQAASGEDTALSGAKPRP